MTFITEKLGTDDDEEDDEEGDEEGGEEAKATREGEGEKVEKASGGNDARVLHKGLSIS